MDHGQRRLDFKVTYRASFKGLRRDDRPALRALVEQDVTTCAAELSGVLAEYLYGWRTMPLGLWIDWPWWVVYYRLFRWLNLYEVLTEWDAWGQFWFCYRIAFGEPSEDEILFDRLIGVGLPIRVGDAS